jgi:hypothetical protein
MNSKKQSEIELMAPEALDVEVTRIAQDKLHPHGCDLVVHRTDDGIARLLIKVQSTGREYHLIRSFFHRDFEIVPAPAVFSKIVE